MSQEAYLASSTQYHHSIGLGLNMPLQKSPESLLINLTRLGKRCDDGHQTPFLERDLFNRGTKGN